jgi:hypothetical protein
MKKLFVVGLIGIFSLFCVNDLAAQERGRRDHRGEEHSRKKAPTHKDKKSRSDRRGGKRSDAKCGVKECRCTCHKKSNKSRKGKPSRRRGMEGMKRIREAVKSGKITREEAVKRIAAMRSKMGKGRGEGRRDRRRSRGAREERGSEYRKIPYNRRGRAFRAHGGF